jgi:hypothetical protein
MTRPRDKRKLGTPGIGAQRGPRELGSPHPPLRKPKGRKRCPKPRGER